jgi:hypothetical protein
MLKHPWLRMAPRQDFKMSRRELREYKKVHGYEVSESNKSNDDEEEE